MLRWASALALPWASRKPVATLVLTPLAIEGKSLVRVLTQVRRGRVEGHTFWRGKAGKAEVVVFVCGVGSKKAGAGTRLAVQTFLPRRLLVFGCAGALAPELSIGDLIVADSVVDWDVWRLSRGDGIQDCDPELLRWLGAAGARGGARGTIVCSDRLIAGGEERTLRWELLQAAAADWESAAVVAEARQLGVPAAVVRVVSDYAGESAEQEFLRNSKAVLRLAGLHVAALLERIPELTRKGDLSR